MHVRFPRAAWLVATALTLLPLAVWASETVDIEPSPPPAPADLEPASQADEPQAVDSTIDAVPPDVPADPDAQAALDTALGAATGSADNSPTVQVAPVDTGGSGPDMQLIDVSLDILFAAGTSTADGEELAALEGGGHDPNRRGFSLQGSELALSGVVDQFATANTNVVFLQDGVELEEAYLTTTTLGKGLELKGGLFLTEFGRINNTHPHSWAWVDQPFINTRILGGDGTRGPGVRLAAMMPAPWYSRAYFTIQNSDNDTMVSFRGAGEDADGTTIGGRTAVPSDKTGDMLLSARWENSWPFHYHCGTGESLLGVSYALGPNLSGPGGHTSVYGADWTVKWKPDNNFRGYPYINWETELLGRSYHADRFFDDSDPANVIDLPEANLGDWGWRSQFLYGFKPEWSYGLRYEQGGGSGESVGGRANDPFRDNRRRWSPVLQWAPTHFSRIRAQYNYDVAQHLGGPEQSVWVGAEVLIGKHPAHSF